MEAGRDQYNQQVEVSFSELEGDAPVTSRRGLWHALRHRLAALPSLLATLRKVTLDASAVALVLVVVGYFISALNQESILIEEPSVPKSLQDRGLTPALLTQLIQTRVRGIYAAAANGEIVVPEKTEEELPPTVPVDVIQAQIDSIYQSFGLPVSADAAAATTGAATRAVDEAFPLGNVERDDPSAAERVIAATDESIGMVTDQINRALETTRSAEIAAPPSAPLVVATAGLHLSVDSLAHAARRLLGIETQRRLMVSIFCASAACDDGTLSLHIVATADKGAVVEGVPLNGVDLDKAIGAAADYVLQAYDPQVLASFHYKKADLAAAWRVAAAMVDRNPRLAAWAESLLGLIAMREANYHKAGKHLESALAIDSADVPTRVNLGVVQFRTGDFEAAKVSFAVALETDPNYAVAQVNLGNTLLRLCDWDGAAKAYERALELDPQSASAQYSLDLVRSIPALKAYLPDGEAQRASVARGNDGTANLEQKGRRLDQVIAAASFCTDLARKPL